MHPAPEAPTASSEAPRTAASSAPSLRAFALALLDAETLAGKLAPPPAELPDHAPGEPLRVLEPRRPPDLAIVAGRRAKAPPVEGMHDPAQRVRILHALANHELQAAELFAWALLAFPRAPAAFRRGCLGILADEQAHCRAYVARIEALGSRFGAFPVSGHFWRRVPELATPLAFVCAMGLTFENANLDFSVEHARAARAAGDEETARVLERVHEEEILHVRFAYAWLLAWKDPAQTPWQAYSEQVGGAHAGGASRARGAEFDAACRRAAGMDEDFVAQLAATAPERPGGARR